ncbi:hypothetical protein [Aurantiacibacter luteus]|uniref:Uncharacterized protein n=1 Tax=Aurantiacibacter luteus TaxID=1581420 RepID=A0A0G9MUY1_9SPHN|nr:hypothetical protein [Aurantiacibacter luteus]KLE34552.1 hypothetical protein AAW00_10110 [Aurantiacibacter luteus]
MRGAFPSLALALAACTVSQTDEMPQPEPVMTTPAMAEDAPPASAPGQKIDETYAVATLDGAPIAGGTPGQAPRIILTVDRVHFSSGCIYADWTYRHTSGASYSAQRFYEPGSAMCARGLATFETAIEELFDGLDGMTRHGDGTVIATGAGHRLVLRPVQSARIEGAWRVTAVDGAQVDEYLDLALLVDATTITFRSACDGYGWFYQADGGSIATDRRFQPAAECLARARIHHAVFDVATAIDAATILDRTPDGGLVLTGGGHSVTVATR